MQYNAAHGITPTQIRKSLSAPRPGQPPASYAARAYVEPESTRVAEDPIVRAMDREQLSASIEHTRDLMRQAAKKLDFALAAQYRDEMLRLEDYAKEKYGAEEKKYGAEEKK